MLTRNLLALAWFRRQQTNTALSVRSLGFTPVRGHLSSLFTACSLYFHCLSLPFLVFSLPFLVFHCLSLPYLVCFTAFPCVFSLPFTA